MEKNTNRHLEVLTIQYKRYKRRYLKSWSELAGLTHVIRFAPAFARNVVRIFFIFFQSEESIKANTLPIFLIGVGYRLGQVSSSLPWILPKSIVFDFDLKWREP